MIEPNDIQRLKNEYEDRKHRLDSAELYSVFNPAQLFMLHSRERKLLACLRANGFSSLNGRRILEIGCGGGGVLKEYLRYGVAAEELHGIDLLLDRLHAARKVLPDIPLVNSNGAFLPYPEQSFDLVLQYTAFSSILDLQVKRGMAGEMLRVLKPEGMIIWYDFWLNPTNKQTKGIKPAEIRSLFSSCQYAFHKITLAPPIARRIVPVSWGFARFLETLKVFNSHYLAVISR